jgi:hypothetical protein
LVVRGGRARVFFSSPDPLAPGASEDGASLYEWVDGQVFRIATEPTGESVVPLVNFAGADLDGTDLYFAAPQPPTGEGGDQRLAIYDARVGGGFPEPGPGPIPCSATTEGSCQGAPAAASPAPGPASDSFSGPGNPPQPSAKKSKWHQKKHKKHHKKHERKPKKHKKKGGKGKHNRHAQQTRRARK